MPQNNAKTIGVGIVGCGWAARDLHLPALRSLPGVRVVALADSDAQRVESLAADAGVDRRYASAAALAADPDIDAVVVAVPTKWHVEAACEALAAGKHVLVEKPLAATLEECDAAIRARENGSRKAMVGFNLRWNANVRQARELIRQGRLGRIEMIRSAQTGYHATIPSWRARRETGGGALWEIAPHHVDLWRFLLGDEVAEIFASTASDEWDDCSASLSGRMTGGAVVSACFGQRTTSMNEIEILGQRGRLWVSCYQFDGLRFEEAGAVPGSAGARLRFAALALRKLPAGLALARQGGIHKTTFRAEWEHFLAAIQSGAEVESALEDGRRVTEVILAALESAATGRLVRVDRG
ncbi:MAG: Gfo/Idh/MocA family oxidoreductase [Bryobacteraceae bacterium]|nr:Gfo/Idh/MocA family oxidoreductase [Bryobacteraceae bacterium]